MKVPQLAHSSGGGSTEGRLRPMRQRTGRSRGPARGADRGGVGADRIYTDVGLSGANPASTWSGAGDGVPGR